MEPCNSTIFFSSIEPGLDSHRMVGRNISVNGALFGLEMDVDRQSKP